MLTTDLLKEMRSDLKDLLKEFESKYDVSVDIGNISYTEFNFTTKLTVTLNEAYTEEGMKKLFVANCKYYGLKPEHYKYEFEAIVKGKREKFELIGFELSRSKFPIKARSLVSGKEMLFTKDIVKDIAWTWLKHTTI